MILTDPISYVTTGYFIDSLSKHIIDVIFYCKLINTKLTINVSTREVPEYYWLTPDAILKHENSPCWLKTYITSCMNLIEN